MEITQKCGAEVLAHDRGAPGDRDVLAGGRLRGLLERAASITSVTK